MEEDNRPIQYNRSGGLRGAPRRYSIPGREVWGGARRGASSVVRPFVRSSAVLGVRSSGVQRGRGATRAGCYAGGVLRARGATRAGCYAGGVLRARGATQQN